MLTPIGLFIFKLKNLYLSTKQKQSGWLNKVRSYYNIWILNKLICVIIPFIKKVIITAIRWFITNCSTIIAQLVIAASHYYNAYYKQNKSIMNLYPAFADINLNSILSLVTKNNKPNTFIGIIYIVIHFTRYWVLPIVLFISMLSLLFIAREVPVSKFLFTIISLGFFIYLLISGFVFFFKKYKYSKYTTAMHRFWRRAFSIFWLLEGFLFVIFLYLTVFANQEPFYMYDNSQFFKNFNYPWRVFLQEVTVLILIIILLRFAVIRLKDTAPLKLFLVIYIISLLAIIIAWSEFYQFYYTLNHYNNIDWVYDEEAAIWSIELEAKKSRILLHFITICIIAKFWHFVFILGFWVFSVLRWLQLRTVHLPLLSVNLQNFIILYVLNWIVMYPWAKYVFRRHLYKNYTWLYTNFRSIGIRVFFLDFYNYSYSLMSMSWLYQGLASYYYNTFTYQVTYLSLHGMESSWSGFNEFAMASEWKTNFS